MPFFDPDDLSIYPKIDQSNIRKELLNLPNQLNYAWKIGVGYELPLFSKVTYIVLVAMGGKAIGAGLLAAHLADKSLSPVHILREYQLPSWSVGEQTLVVASSQSGDTEEVLSAFDLAMQRHCHLMVISTGGEISSKAKAHSIPLWRFSHKGQPRTAAGYSFRLLLALMTRLSHIADQ